jgi:iron complex outermembrane receptor protein
LAIGEDADCSSQINALVIANPDLGSEQSDQYSLGVVYQVTDAISVELDYYNIEITNRIRAFSAQSIIDARLRGDSVPDAFTVSRSPNGAITSLVRGFGNDGSLETSGIDFKANSMFEFGDAGTLRTNFNLSHIVDYKTDGGRNFVDDPGVPQMRLNLSNVYSISDFDFTWNLNLIDSQCEDITADGECEGHIPSWVTHDLQVAYNTPWNGKVSFGAQNAFGKQPPLFAFGGRDYNFDLYSGFGRTMYLNFKQSF